MIYAARSHISKMEIRNIRYASSGKDLSPFQPLSCPANCLARTRRADDSDVIWKVTRHRSGPCFDVVRHSVGYQWPGGC